MNITAPRRLGGVLMLVAVSITPVYAADALAQLWMFWVAPLIGAALAGVAYRWLGSEKSA